MTMDCFSLQLVVRLMVEQLLDRGGPHGVPQPVIFLNGAPAFKHTSPQSGGEVQIKNRGAGSRTDPSPLNLTSTDSDTTLFLCVTAHHKLHLEEYF